MSRASLSPSFAAALALTGGLGAAAPASAQWFDGPPGPYIYAAPPGYSYFGPQPYGYGYGYRYRPGPYGRPLSPDVIVERLEDADYDRVSRPLFNGSTYTVDATAPNGRRVRVVLDAFRGNVLGQHPADGSARVSAYPPEMDSPRPTPRRREAARPLPPPGIDGSPDPASPGVTGRRSSARPDAGLNPGTLPAPADPRLAPRVGEDGQADTGPRERTRREAVRSEPSTARTPAKPQTTAPGRRDPAPAAAPKAPAPAPVTRAPPPPAERPAAAADAARSERPVRVIEGVTPVRPSSSAAPSGPAQLDNLPQPPAVVPPGAASE